MNMQQIIDYLAKTSNPVQLVKHLDEVPESKIKYPLIAQKKFDGLYVLTVVTRDSIRFFSRTGKEYYQELGTWLPNYSELTDGVYIGELCNDAIELEVLAGYVSTNRKKQWSDDDCYLMKHTYIMFHDYLKLDELLDGHSDTSYRNRYSNLENRLRNAGILEYIVESKLIYGREHADAYTENLISQGSEGAVFKDPNANWEAGHKGYRSMKIVRGLHVDLLCVGVEYGKGKRTGQVAKLQFSYKGNVFSADLGKGWTDERRKALTQGYEAEEFHGARNDADPIGKIWEVKALQESSTGKALRLPKVVRVREDKETPDA